MSSPVKARNGATSRCDVVLDLTGGASLFAAADLLSQLLRSGRGEADPVPESGAATAPILRAPRRPWSTLEAARISALAREQVASLPYGKRHFDELARALVAQPDVILLDEPATGLTDAERESLVALVRRITANGSLVVLVEHDLELVGRLCDCVTVIEYGRKIFGGTPLAAQHQYQCGFDRGGVHVDPVGRAAPEITKVESAPPATSPSCGQQPLHRSGGPSRSSKQRAAEA